MAPRDGRKDRPSKDLDPTKIDLPFHFLHGRLRVEKVPLSRDVVSRGGVRSNKIQHIQRIHRGAVFIPCPCLPHQVMANGGLPRGDYQAPSE